MLNYAYLLELEDYLRSGRLEEDFKWSVDERREEILEFLEKLMDLGDLADEAATRLIFKGSALGALLSQGPASAEQED